MNTQQQVGKMFANITPFLTDVGRLAKVCQLQSPCNQSVAEMLADWHAGNSANLPTTPTRCSYSFLPLIQVGENSPSYYVGEGTEVPSSLRRRESSDLDSFPEIRRSILALDLGTTTGWALKPKSGPIAHGHAGFRPQRFEGGGMRYLRFKRWLTEIKAITGDIHAVYFEEVRRHVGVDAAHVYGGLMATLTAWCEHHNIPYQGVPVGTIKKHVTGRGNASKVEVMEAMRAKGHPVTDDNEADALALLYWAMDQEL
jgi:hypothetical protein